MKTISFKIDDDIFEETENILSRIKTSRNQYINEALKYYNKVQSRRLLENRLKNDSDLVKAESISVLYDFESIE